MGLRQSWATVSLKTDMLTANILISLCSSQLDRFVMSKVNAAITLNCMPESRVASMVETLCKQAAQQPLWRLQRPSGRY